MPPETCILVGVNFSILFILNRHNQFQSCFLLDIFKDISFTYSGIVNRTVFFISRAKLITIIRNLHDLGYSKGFHSWSLYHSCGVGVQGEGYSTCENWKYKRLRTPYVIVFHLNNINNNKEHSIGHFLRAKNELTVQITLNYLIAKPRNVVRSRKKIEHILIFSHLGPMKFQLFLGRLRYNSYFQNCQLPDLPYRPRGPFFLRWI